MYEKKYTKNRQIGRYIALIWILNVVYCEGKRKHISKAFLFSHIWRAAGDFLAARSFGDCEIIFITQMFAISIQ